VLLGSATVLGAALVFVVAVDASQSNPDWLEDGDVLGIPAPLVLAILLEAFFLIAVFIFAVSRHVAPIPQLGFVPATGRRPYLLAIVAWLSALIALLIWAGLTELLGIDLLKIPDPPAELVDYSGISLAYPLLVVGLFGPFCEEVFFRGFALPAFAKRYGLNGGILISAALFSVFHFSIGSFVPIFIFGIVLAWLYIRTGSIYPSIIAHSTQNVVATLIAT
jgi:membrane protease YdiL (CAAX protease family)